jgi:hypothetical protein
VGTEKRQTADALGAACLAAQAQLLHGSTHQEAPTGYGRDASEANAEWLM